MPVITTASTFWLAFGFIRLSFPRPSTAVGRWCLRHTACCTARLDKTIETATVIGLIRNFIFLLRFSFGKFMWDRLLRPIDKGLTRPNTILLPINRPSQHNRCCAAAPRPDSARIQRFVAHPRHSCRLP